MVTSRIWFTAAQKAELWERWKNGQSAAAISRALERKNKTGVERIVVLHGGIGPAPRRRALAALRFEEREEISRGISVGRSIRQIAQGLRRAPSTESREIRRNGGSQAYRANRADRRARERRCAPSLVVCAVQRATMARGAEARAAMVAAADLRLAEAGVPNPPRHADISRSDLSQPLHPDPRRAEKGAVGAVRTARRMRHPKSHNAKSGQGHIPPSPTLGGRIHIPPPMTLRRKSVPASGLAGMRVFGWPRGSAPGVPACCFSPLRLALRISVARPTAAFAPLRHHLLKFGSLYPRSQGAAPAGIRPHQRRVLPFFTWIG